MKVLSPTGKCILITHAVNPHQFYFKYVNDVVNSEFSKFDFEIQIYGNELHAQNTYEHGYLPAENEIVIFFNVIYNKWVRGRMVSVGEEMVFWCIDSGIYEKCAAKHVLPLTERFHEDLNLVHLGGLSLLPTEKTLNVHTVEVETHLSEQWDDKSIILFKGIVSTSKTFMFTAEFELEGHKFGWLAIESKSANKKGINEILLAMNNAAPYHQFGHEDILVSYVNEILLETQLHYSIINALKPAEKVNNNSVSMRTMRPSKFKSGSDISSENLSRCDDFDDTSSRQSSSEISTVHEPEIEQIASAIAETHVNGQSSESVRHKTTESSCVTYRAEILNGETNDDSENLACAQVSSLSLRQNGFDFPHEESHLRSFKVDSTQTVPRQPLSSTMSWIDLMNQSVSSRDASYKSCASNIDDADGRRSQQSASPTLSTKSTLAMTSAVSRRSKLATLAETGPASKLNKIVNKSADADSRLFGIPAGYAKNCLDTFGGINKSP